MRIYNTEKKWWNITKLHTLTQLFNHILTNNGQIKQVESYNFQVRKKLAVKTCKYMQKLTSITI